MKIAVIGPGAIGTVFGGMLADAGHDVCLLHHRESYVDRIEEAGVRIEDVEADVPPIRVHVPATTDAASVGPVELALVLVRSYQTIDAVTEHAGCIGPDTRVLSLQNGLSNHYRLRDHLGPARTLFGVTRQGGVLEKPGHVIRTGTGPTVFGGADGAFAERIEETFRAAGIDATSVEDPFYHVWRKQVFGGAIKPTAALTRLANGDLVSDDGMKNVMERLVREASAVARARGHPIDADEVFDELRTGLQGSAHRSSMLQDVDARVKTEIDECNGAVVEFAAREEVDVPYNELATKLVRGLERGYLEEDRTR